MHLISQTLLMQPPAQPLVHYVQSVCFQVYLFLMMRDFLMGGDHVLESLVPSIRPGTQWVAYERSLSK